MQGSDDLIPYYLALHRSPSLGPATVNRLLNACSSIETLFSSDAATLRQFSLAEETVDYLLKPDWKTVEQDMNWLSQPQHSLLLANTDGYPTVLKHISQPPLLLFVDGNKDVLSSEQMAIVGSRRPTAAGKKIAKEFAYELSEAGLTITSGLALGIDYQSHLGALDANGSTVAVLGNGIDTVYPKKHQALADSIKEKGAIVSEFPTATPPLPHHFPRRNRIISGLSLGCLVVEAAKKSGSLITAHYALEQGREVFAVPGSVLNPLSAGCHSLLKQGAKLVETTDDIFEEIHYQITNNNNCLKSGFANNGLVESLPTKHQALLEMIGFEPISIDELVAQSGLTTDELSSMLLTLELEGHLQSQMGGSYLRITKNMSH